MMINNWFCSGIDYRHAALGGCFGTGCRVAYGYNFIVDGTGTSKVTDPIDNCNGHGTHVAGIIGMDFNFVDYI